MNNTSQIKIYYKGEIGDISGMLKRANEELINRNNESFLFDYEIGLSNGFDGSTIVTIILSVSTPILLFLKSSYTKSPSITQFHKNRQLSKSFQIYHKPIHNFPKIKVH